MVIDNDGKNLQTQILWNKTDQIGWSNKNYNPIFHCLKKYNTAKNEIKKNNILESFHNYEDCDAYTIEDNLMTGASNNILIISSSSAS